jgi:hypothetical protein
LSAVLACRSRRQKGDLRDGQDAIECDPPEVCGRLFGGVAKHVAYCPSWNCPLWAYQFGKRPETLRERIGAAMLSPELMPDPDTPLEELPNNPADYRLAIEAGKAAKAKAGSSAA